MFSQLRHFQNALQPLVRSALALPPTQYGSWLNELRADCPTVARELERLLPPVMRASLTTGSEVAICDVVPGSLEHLGLRC